MSDIKLFRTSNGMVNEIKGTSVQLEKSLQTLIEQHLETFFGIRLVASEHSTGKVHGGRVDTLGLDENGYPIIIEYKRALNQNVINQGLSYLAWLIDHKAEFQLLVMKRFDVKVAENIDWTSPRLLCIAGDFTKNDENAVNLINHNIELIRYRRYGTDFLLFELVNATRGQQYDEVSFSISPSKGRTTVSKRTAEDLLAQATTNTRDRFEAITALLLALGDDVQTITTKTYIAFRRLKNFACFEIHSGTGIIRAFVKVNPDTVTLERNFTRDVRGIGHHGTGDLEITIRTDSDVEKAEPLLIKAYESN
jgi:predicted transport protein